MNGLNWIVVQLVLVATLPALLLGQHNDEWQLVENPEAASVQEITDAIVLLVRRADTDEMQRLQKAIEGKEVLERLSVSSSSEISFENVTAEIAACQSANARELLLLLGNSDVVSSRLVPAKIAVGRKRLNAVVASLGQLADEDERIYELLGKVVRGASLADRHVALEALVTASSERAADIIDENFLGVVAEEESRPSNFNATASRILGKGRLKPSIFALIVRNVPNANKSLVNYPLQTLIANKSPAMLNGDIPGVDLPLFESLPVEKIKELVIIAKRVDISTLPESEQRLFNGFVSRLVGLSTLSRKELDQLAKQARETPAMLVKPPRLEFKGGSTQD